MTLFDRYNRFVPVSIFSLFFALTLFLIAPLELYSVEGEEEATEGVVLETQEDAAKVLVPKKPVIYQPRVGNGSQSIGASSVTLICIYIILFAAGILVFSKIQNGRSIWGLTKGKGGDLNIEETKILGNKQFLLVVDYKGEKMLLGVGPGLIKYLCPLSGQKGVAEKENDFNLCVDLEETRQKVEG